MSQLWKAEELCKIVCGILDKSDASVILYSRDEGSNSDRNIEHLIYSGEISFSYFNVGEDGSTVDNYVFINIDKALQSASNEDFEALCHHLVIDPTPTNRFLFVLLHQLGHWWQAELLGSNGQAKLIHQVRYALDNALPEEFIDSELGCTLDPESLFADFYAVSTIHRVLKVLESLNADYLTYLD